MPLPVFPNLPTDNYYKFVFLTGIVSCLTAIILFTTRYEDFSEDIRKVEVELAHISLDIQFLKEDLNKDSVSSNKALISINDSVALKSELINIKEKQRAIIKRHIDTNLSSEDFRERYRDFIIESISYFILFTIGLLMTTWGGKNWYQLVQKPLDEKLRLELEQMKKDS